MKSEYPYSNLEYTILWSILEKGIEDLVDNNDIVEYTDRKYIVGYLCKILQESGLVNKNSV